MATTAKKVAKKAPAKKAAKKVAKKAPAKKVAKKVAKKAPAKKAAKKVAKKAPAKKVAKKVAKKAPAKKAAKKVAKKAPARVVKKDMKCGCCEHAVTKKAPAKKAAPAAKKPVAIERDASKPLSKTQLIAIIADTVEVEKKKVAAILDFIPELIGKELTKPGIFQIPGLIKIEKKKIPAQKPIKNWKNPFTGEITTKPGKPACNKIKVRALKKLKDMA